jgi:DNA-binding GntR family transcriptional regulator
MSKNLGYTSKSAGLSFRIAESTTVQESVLDLLMAGAGTAYTELQVRERLGLPKSSTHRALKELADQGLASVESVGRTLLYRIDPDDPLVHHLKIARAISKARSALAPVADDIDLAVLFGSASRGEDTEGSDLDLFVVTSDVDRVLGELARHGWLQPVVVTPSQHMQIIAEGGAFSRAIAEGIRVGGRR